MATTLVKDWTKLLGLKTQLNAVSIGLDGSIYIVGSTSFSLDGQTYSGGYSDAILIKYSADGTKIWTRLLGSAGEDNAKALTIGLDGSIYISGGTRGALDGQIYSGFYDDAFITKYSSDGTKSWTKVFGSSGNDVAEAMTTGIDGSIYVSGKVNEQIFIAKYNSNGIQSWIKLLGNGYGPALALGLDGSIYLNVETYKSEVLSTVLNKYSPDGTEIWSKSVAGGGSLFTAVATGLDGSIYVGGTASSSFDGQTSSNGAELGPFLIKYSADGTKIWTRLLNEGKGTSAIVRDLTIGIDGSIYIGGTAFTDFDFETINGISDAFLTKYNVDGTKIWTKFQGNEYFDFGTALATGLDGSIYLGGFVSGSDGFLVKYKAIEDASMYSLSPSNTSVSEGSVATFILKTVNIATGTSIRYTLSGISPDDVSGGLLGGNVIVNSSGLATISVSLLNDSLTEGTETLTVSVGGALATTLVYDTSLTPTYKLTALTTQVNESVVLSIDPVTLTRTAIQVIDKPGVDDPVNMFAGVTKWYVDPANGRNLPVIGEIYEGDIGFFYIPAIDPEGSTLSFSIQDRGSTGGDDSDASLFTMSAGTNYFKFTTPPDFENPRDKKLLNNQDPNNIISGAADNVYAVEAVASGYGTHYAIIVKNVNEPTDLPNFPTTASFALSTTNVPSGTSLSYLITGVNSDDIVFGNLSGTFIVYSGTNVIEIPLAADSKTEGSETLTITINGASASTIINDTSQDIITNSTYRISTSNSSINEGSNAVFTLTTTNVAAGTSVPYTISGLSSTDITGGATTGNAIVSSSGTATITIPIAADLTTEGTETLTVTAQQVSSSILITDTSITPVTVTQPNTTVTSIPYGSGQYFLPTTGADRVTGTAYIDVVKQSSSLSANQIIKLSDGSWQIQNKLTPTNTDTLVNVERIDFTDYSVALDVTGSAGQVAKILGSVFGATYVKNPAFTGIGLAYLDSGMAYKDLAKLAADVAGLTTPDAIVSALWKNVIGSSATEANKAPYIKSLNDGMSVGDLVVLASDSSINLQSINFSEISTSGLTYIPSTVPTVTATPTYSLISNQTTVNEGSSATFTLTTTNVASGTALTYSLSGVSSSDLTSGSLNGSLTIGSNGNGTITIPIAADNLTEGSESLNVTVQGATASSVIADTSTTLKPTYSLTPAATSVNEGQLAQVYVVTTNVASGTNLQYSVTGISQSDIVEELLRIATVDADGRAVISINTVADLLTEGNETMTFVMGDARTSITINDTSVTLVGVIESGGGDGGGGGAGGAGGD